MTAQLTFGRRFRARSSLGSGLGEERHAASSVMTVAKDPPFRNSRRFKSFSLSVLLIVGLTSPALRQPAIPSVGFGRTRIKRLSEERTCHG